MRNFQLAVNVKYRIAIAILDNNIKKIYIFFDIIVQNSNCNPIFYIDRQLKVAQVIVCWKCQKD